MNAATFASALGVALKRNDSRRPSNGQPASWTLFMKGCLLDLAEANKMHMCAEGIGRIPSVRVDPGRHMSKEFLFDCTLYAEKDWEAWSLPTVVIEHENEWSEPAFFQDFWKILIAHAPLRVMFGYAKKREGVERLSAAIREHAVKSGWWYPSNVEDIVFLRSPENGGMPWPMWRIVYRRASSKDWKDFGDQPLDDRPIRFV